MTYVRNLSETAWRMPEGEKRPGWLAPRRRVWSPLKQAHIDHIVYNHWFPALRRWYTPEGRVQNAPDAEHSFGVAVRVVVGIQEMCKVASRSSRSVAVRHWANISLTDADKENIEAVELSVETMLQDIGAMIYDGYRFSMTFDAYSRAVQATLVCANPEHGNYECGLSARHPDPVLAIQTLLYKHGLTLDTGYREFSTKPPVDPWG